MRNTADCWQEHQTSPDSIFSPEKGVENMLKQSDFFVFFMQNKQVW